MTSIRWRIALRGAFAALAALAGTAVLASPTLHCELKQSLTVVSADFAAVSDPYGVAAVDVDGIFRFKAVVFGAGDQVEYVKLYTYYQSDRQAVLLHEAKYSPPPGLAANWQFAEQRIYSPDLGRELIVTCGWKGAQP